MHISKICIFEMDRLCILQNMTIFKFDDYDYDYFEIVMQYARNMHIQNMIIEPCQGHPEKLLE